MWNPSSPKLVNFEVDEAGRLAAFRARFGRSFDAGTAEEEVVEKAEQGEGETEKEKRKQDQQQQLEEEDDNLLDLISSFGQEEAPLPEPKAKGKGRK